MPTALRAQTGRAIELSYKEQTDYDVPASGASANRIRFANSSGLLFNKARVPSRESRNDGKGKRGSHGPGLGEFAVSNDFVLGPAYTDPIKHVMRTATIAAATKTQVEVGGTITGVSGATITFSGGSDATAHFKPGDLFTAASGLNAADLNKPLGILTVSATTIVVHRALTTNGAAATFSFAKAKYNLDGAVDSVMTFEEFRENLNRHEIGPWGRWGSFALSHNPGGSMFDIAFNCAYARKTIKGAGTTFTTPSLATGNGVTSSRGKLFIPGISGGIRLSAVNFGKNLNLFRDDTAEEEAYEIGVGQPTWTGQFTAAEVNHDLQDAYDAETVLSAFYLIDTPAGAASLWFPQFVLQQPQKSAIGADNFSTRTFQMDFDVDERGGVFESTNFKFASTI